MAKLPELPEDTTPPKENPELVFQAMLTYVDDSLKTEETIRELLAKGGFNDEDSPVEDCVADLMQAYLRLASPC